MLPSFLLLFACAGDGDQNSVAQASTAQPVFDGYHVEICAAVDWNVANTQGDKIQIIIAEISGREVVSGERTVELTNSGTIDGLTHYCAQNVVLPAPNGHALSLGVAASRYDFEIAAVEVTYRLIEPDFVNKGGFPYTDTSVNDCGENQCGTIFAKRDNSAQHWWRFNIVGASRSSSIPTAIVNTAR